MTATTLSGGNFGGQVMDIPDGQADYIVTDESGGQWKYSVSPHPDWSGFAVFVEFIPA